MADRIRFENRAMKQYEKKGTPSLVPMLVVMALLLLAGRYLFAGEASPLPHVELTRHFAAGGSQSLLLDCQAEADPKHFFCRLERQINAETTASTVLDEATAGDALKRFFSAWPKQQQAPSTGRPSLSWNITDGER